MKQITFKQYRKIDIAILSVLTMIFEGIATYAANYKLWAAQPLAVSVTLTMTCIAMLRWSELALIPSVLGSFIYCVVSGGSLSQYIIYCLGSLFCIFTVPLLKKLDKEKVRCNFLRRAAFVLINYVFIVLGRWLVSLVFTFSLSSIVAFVFSPTDLLSLLFALLVVSLAKNADGLIEDQKTYLLRLEEEKQEESQADQNDQF